MPCQSTLEVALLFWKTARSKLGMTVTTKAQADAACRLPLPWDVDFCNAARMLQVDQAVQTLVKVRDEVIFVPFRVNVSGIVFQIVLKFQSQHSFWRSV